MNKMELINILGDEYDIPKPYAKQYVEKFFDLIISALAKGDRVELRGLCTLHVKEYDSYKGRNPKTGEIVRVKPKKLPFFKPGTDLKNRVNQER